MSQNAYCPKDCKWLKYDKKRSLPSMWIGEGYYVYDCEKLGTRLSVYNGCEPHPLKCDDCTVFEEG